jgi:ribose transport system substrate-binding protein
VDKRITVCHPTAANSPYGQAIIASAQAWASVLNVQYDYFDTKSDPPTEIAEIENCIAKKYDVIVVHPTDGNAVVPVVKKAYEAGIKIINLSQQVGADAQQYVSTYIGTDCNADGTAAADMVIKALGGPGKAQGNVVEIQGAPGHPCIPGRGTLWEKLIAKEPGIHLLAVETANWDQAQAQTVMENFLTKYPGQINLIYAHAFTMSLGALTAIQAAGLNKAGASQATDIKVVGIGCDKDEVDAINAGTYYGCIVSSPVFHGENMIQRARDLVNGIPVAPQVISSSVEITKDNVAGYTPW